MTKFCEIQKFKNDFETIKNLMLYIGKKIYG